MKQKDFSTARVEKSFFAQNPHRVPPRDTKGDAFRPAGFGYGLRPPLKMTAEGATVILVGVGALDDPQKNEKNQVKIMLSNI